MKEVSVGEEGQVLLIRQNGRYSAIGHKCTHYGAPLVKGCLGEGRVRCPWHGACFNATTGDIEDFPGLDSLAQYEVTVKGEEVIVRAKKEVSIGAPCNAIHMHLLGVGAAKRPEDRAGR